MASRSLPLLRAAARPVAALRTPVVARFVAPTRAAVSSRAFAMTASKFKAVESDGELTSILKEELEYESQDAKEKKTFEAFQETRSSIEALGFKITESEGADEVLLTKQIDNETITVSFSTSGVESAENPELQLEENEEDPDLDVESSYLPVAITITKASDPAALVIDTIVEDSQFTISDVLYYKDGKLASDKSAEAAEKRGELYDGPAFDHLDPTVQENFQLFIEARGFDQTLADAIIELQRGKEVREYVSWLDGVRKFIDA